MESNPFREVAVSRPLDDLVKVTVDNCDEEPIRSRAAFNATAFCF